MTIWYGKEAAVTIGTAFTVATTSSYWAQATAASGTDYSAECTDLTINPGEAGVDVLNVYGDQLAEESRPELITADFTMLFSDIDIWKFSMATAATITGYVSYRGEDQTGSKTKRSVAFKVADSTKGTVIALLNNSYVVAQGELSLAADGRAEQTFSAVCLKDDFYVQEKA